MELRFNSQKVCNTLSQVSTVIAAKNTIPILSSFLVELKGEYARVTASDTEMWITMKTDIQSDCDNFRFCIDANKLLSALRILENRDMHVTFDDNNKKALFSYGMGEFVLPYDTDTDYPKDSISVDDIGSFTMTADNLFGLVNNVSFASSDDILRQSMNGVHFDISNNCIISVACDSQKLAKKTVRSECEDKGTGFTLPNKLVTVLKNILNGRKGDIKVRYGTKCVMFLGDDFYLSSRLVDAKFPSYGRIIPSLCNGELTVDRDNLLSALRRVSPMGNVSSELVRVGFSQNLITLRTENIDYNTSACEEIECEYTGEEMEIGFKMSNLVDTLRNLKSDIITIEVVDPRTACVIHNGSREDYISLVMPMFIM